MWKNAIVVRNDVLLCDLDLWPLNPKTVTFLKYPKIIPYIKFEHFGIIRFESYAADKQTNKQTDSKILPTPTDWVGVGNKAFVMCHRVKKRW